MSTIVLTQLRQEFINKNVVNIKTINSVSGQIGVLDLIHFRIIGRFSLKNSEKRH